MNAGEFTDRDSAESCCELSGGFEGAVINRTGADPLRWVFTTGLLFFRAMGPRGLPLHDSMGRMMRG